MFVLDMGMFYNIYQIAINSKIRIGKECIMKISVNEVEIEIGDWNSKLKVTTIVLATISIILLALNLFTKIIVPGLVPITIGCTMLLLGVREFNVYFKREKHYLVLVTAGILSLIFIFCLYTGINQIISAMTDLFL